MPSSKSLPLEAVQIKTKKKKGGKRNYKFFCGKLDNLESDYNIYFLMVQKLPT